MAISRFFAHLGAPLRNYRWSWGAIDRQGRAILRAWRDETRIVGGETYILVARHSAYTDKQSHPGYQERLRHLDALRKNCPTFALIVEARDTDARPGRSGALTGPSYGASAM